MCLCLCESLNLQSDSVCYFLQPHIVLICSMMGSHNLECSQLFQRETWKNTRKKLNSIKLPPIELDRFLVPFCPGPRKVAHNAQENNQVQTERQDSNLATLSCIAIGTWSPLSSLCCQKSCGAKVIYVEEKLSLHLYTTHMVDYFFLSMVQTV